MAETPVSRIVAMRKSKNEVITEFRELPLDVRLEEAIRTFEEYEKLQKKWKSIMDKLATGSDKYKEAIAKKKPMDKLLDKFMNMVEVYMMKNFNTPINEEKRNELRELVQEVLSEGEE